MQILSPLDKEPDLMNGSPNATAASIINENNRLSDYIVGIKNVDVISVNGDEIEAYYTGIMLSGGQINGQFKLKKNNRGYYIRENKVETAYYIK